MPGGRRSEIVFSALRAALAVLSFVLLCSPRAANAQADFAFDAPCASTQDFVARIGQLLPEGESPSALLSGGSVSISADGDAFVLRLDLSERPALPRDRRELRQASCDALVDAAAIMVSLRWQEQHRLAVAAKPQAAPPAEPAPRAQERTLRVALALGASSGTGLLPSFALGLGLGAGIETGVLRIMLEGRFWPEESTPIANSDGRSAASLIEISPSAAWLPLRAGALAFGPQLALAAGRLNARGLGLSVQRADHTWLIRSDLNACVHFEPVGLPIAGMLAVGAGVPWSRPVLTINGSDEAFRLAAVGFRASISVEVHLN